MNVNMWIDLTPSDVAAIIRARCESVGLTARKVDSTSDGGARVHFDFPSWYQDVARLVPPSPTTAPTPEQAGDPVHGCEPERSKP